MTSGFFKSSKLLFGHIDMVIVTITTKRSTCQFKFSKMHIFVYKVAIRSINLAHFFVLSQLFKPNTSYTFDELLSVDLMIQVGYRLKFSKSRGTYFEWSNAHNTGCT